MQNTRNKKLLINYLIKIIYKNYLKVKHKQQINVHVKYLKLKNEQSREK